MADKTKIEWTATVHPDGSVTPGSTWNPVRGCTRVSEGCRFCYAETVAARFSGPGQPYEDLARMTPSGPRWTGQVRLIGEHLADPLRWQRPRRVFVNSMSDLFHEGLGDDQIAAVFGLMAASPRHTFQVLTKRPERMQRFLAGVEASGDPLGELQGLGGGWWPTGGNWPDGTEFGCSEERADEALEGVLEADWPLPNVWLGVSAEDQRRADERIPLLLQTPAAVRFVSVEPLLGPLDLMRYLPCPEWDPDRRDPFTNQQWPRRIHWVIGGGESGANARLCRVEWHASLRDQCRAAGVAYFQKQFGGHVVSTAYPPEMGYSGSFTANGDGWLWHLRDRKGGNPDEWPESLRVREFPEAPHA